MACKSVFPMCLKFKRSYCSVEGLNLKFSLGDLLTNLSAWEWLPTLQYWYVEATYQTLLKTRHVLYMVDTDFHMSMEASSFKLYEYTWISKERRCRDSVVQSLCNQRKSKILISVLHAMVTLGMSSWQTACRGTQTFILSFPAIASSQETCFLPSLSKPTSTLWGSTLT